MVETGAGASGSKTVMYHTSVATVQLSLKEYSADARTEVVGMKSPLSVHAGVFEPFFNGAHHVNLLGSTVVEGPITSWAHAFEYTHSEPTM